MIKTICECDIPLPDSHKICGKHAATRGPVSIPISIAMGKNLYFVCPDCAKLPLEKLLDKLFPNIEER